MKTEIISTDTARAAGIIKKAMDKGLILINAGANIIRFVPALVITRQNVDDMIAILESSIE